MHYTVKFTGSREEQEAQAVKETKQYLGAKTFKRLVEAVWLTWNDRGTKVQRLNCSYLLCDMVGVRGRTVVHALIKHALKG